MVPVTKSPLESCAADLMSSDVVLLPAEMSLHVAARLLDRSQISGAPVVDSSGHCVGVLSTTDFMHCIETEPSPSMVHRKKGAVSCSWQIPAETDTPTTSLVQDFMTRDPVTVSAGTLLPELALAMLEARIHRLIVVDHDARPIGVISTTDILSTLARAAGVGLGAAQEQHVARGLHQS